MTVDPERTGTSRPLLTRSSRFAALAAVALLAAPANAQTGGSEWTAFTSMKQINGVLAGSDIVWSATQGGVLRFDTITQEYTRFTSLDGLAGNSVLCVARDRNGDLWFGTDGKGLSRLKDEPGAKFDPPFLDFEGLRINALLARRDRLFVGTDRGVSVFLIDKQEVKETYRKLGDILTGTAVTALAVYREELWVGTGEGVAWADLTLPNLQDPDSWNSIKGIDVRSLQVTFNGDAVMATPRGVSIIGRDGLLVEDFTDEPTTSVALLRGLPVVAGESGNFFRRDLAGEWGPRISGPIITDVRSMSVRGDALWLGTADGLRAIGIGQPPLTREPAANRFYEMKLHDGDLWVATVPNDHQQSFGLYQKEADDSWTVHNRRTGMPTDDLVSLDSDRAGRLWVGTWGAGVAIRESGRTFLRMDQSNSILEGIGPKGDFVAISDIARDQAGNMWLVNVTIGLAVVDGFPAERSFLFDDVSLGLGPGRDVNSITLGDDGLKWLTSPTHGFVLLDDGGTPFDGDDDFALLIDDAFDSRLTSNRVADLLVGDDGSVWVGTDNDLNAVRGTYSRSGRSFLVDGWRVYTTADGLPSNEINKLEKDDRGNIWVGTEGGLSQIAADGQVVFTLTKTNSGLIDDRVKSLLFDADGGVMWIGTFDGLSRLRISSGSDGELTSSLAVYPNPFFASGSSREELTFAGLPLGASLRVYGLDGQLVAQVPGSPGGASLSWNGLNEAGFLVSSGIYYFVADDGAGERVRGRFAVVNGRSSR